LIVLNAKEKSHPITSNLTFDTKEEALNRSGSILHNRRKQMQVAFYKEIAIEILRMTMHFYLDQPMRKQHFMIT
jgi:hypothetical protein